MKRTLIAALATAVTGAAAHAQSLNDQIIADLTAKGFQRIEIVNGLGQTKVEAIRGTEKLEVVWDSATGQIIKQETEQVRVGEDTTPGLRIRERARTFVDVSRLDDDDDDDEDRRGQGREDDDDDDYDDDHGRGYDDDDDDDDRDDKSGRGGDDDDDEDDHDRSDDDDDDDDDEDDDDEDDEDDEDEDDEDDEDDD